MMKAHAMPPYSHLCSDGQAGIGHAQGAGATAPKLHAHALASDVERRHRIPGGRCTGGRALLIRGSSVWQLRAPDACLYQFLASFP